MSNQKKPKVKLKIVKRAEIDSRVIEFLASPTDPEILAELIARIGHPLFPHTELPGSNEPDRVLKDLIVLWPKNREKAIAQCIEKNGPATRPGLWWHLEVPGGRPVALDEHGSRAGIGSTAQQLAESNWLLSNGKMSLAEKEIFMSRLMDDPR